MSTPRQHALISVPQQSEVKSDPGTVVSPMPPRTKRLVLISYVALMGGTLWGTLYFTPERAAAMVALTSSKIFLACGNILLAKQLIDLLYTYSVIRADDTDKAVFEKEVTKKDLIMPVLCSIMHPAFYIVGHTFHTMRVVPYIILVAKTSFSAMNVAEKIGTYRVMSKDFAIDLIQYIFDILAAAGAQSIIMMRPEQESLSPTCPYFPPSQNFYGVTIGLDDYSQIRCQSFENNIVDCCLYPRIGNNGTCMFFDLNGVNSKIDPTFNLEAEFNAMVRMCGNDTVPLLTFGPINPPHQTILFPATVAELNGKSEKWVTSLTRTPNINSNLEKFFQVMIQKFNFSPEQVTFNIGADTFFAATSMIGPEPLDGLSPLGTQINNLADIIDRAASLTLPSVLNEYHMPVAQKSTVGHELWHVTQHRHALAGCLEGKKAGRLPLWCHCNFENGQRTVVTGNYYEAEADRIGTIANNNPCLAYYFAKIVPPGATIPTNLNSENGGVMLAGESNFDPHPHPEQRIALILKTYFDFRKVVERLTGRCNAVLQ